MFNIRVYGIYINANNELLVSDEFVQDKKLTKLPGGGLEYGEGTIECLKREFREEMNIEIEVVSHFYTTDYFVPSAFKDNQQIISIYYNIQPVLPLQLISSSTPLQLTEANYQTYKATGSFEKHRFMPINALTPTTFTLPIDITVGKLLQKKYTV
jgi:8-oxo-dGTP diphosphatase